MLPLASVASKLPRFTLFVGKQCSLCVTAKEALDSVRKQRPFEVETINIYDPGQEQWRGKFKYEIPVLMMKDQIQAKGRWGEPEILNALKWQDSLKDPEVPLFDPPPAIDLSGASFYVDAEPQPWNFLDEEFDYDAGDHPLGTAAAIFNPWDPPMRGCFNCGSTTHLVSSCPEPPDRERQAANRALYNASKVDSGVIDSKERYYEHDLSIETRLKWVDTFSPGRLIGLDLRDAVGLNSTRLREGAHMLPWFDGGNAEGSFGGMLFWGYPPGWVSVEDPRVEMRRRILEDSGRGFGSDAIHLSILGDEADEIVEVRPPTFQTIPSGPLRRWAHYNTDLFSSDLLTISNVICPLPPIRRLFSEPPPKPSTTFTADRKALWASLTSGNIPTPPKSCLPPWRRPHAFDFSRRFRLLPDGDFVVE